METVTNKTDRSRLVVDIEDELHHRIRVKAVQDRKKMRDVVEACLMACFPPPDRAAQP